MDMGIAIKRRTDVPYTYITEGGVTPDIFGSGSVEAAYKGGEHWLIEMLSGMFQGNMQCGGYGFGPGWDQANTVIATLAFMTEDRPILADIWPYNEMLVGAIFANKKFITDDVKALPRSEDLRQRWEVEVPASRANDVTKVAALFCMTGESNQKIDNQGTLTIDNPADLKAYTMMGGEIQPQGGKLVLPMTQSPVYVLSDNLSVVDLRNRIRGGRLAGVTPVNMYALSLTQPADKKQEMIVRVENQMPCPIEGTLTVQPLDGSASSPANFTIAEGRLKEVRMEWPGAAANVNNVYGIKMTAETKAIDPDGTTRALKSVTRQHLINTALIAKKTISGSSDWNGVTPVILDCGQCNTDIESNLSSFIGGIGGGSVVARVRLAYDDNFVYVGATVKEPRLSAGAGGASSLNGAFPAGLPGGLEIPMRTTDGIALGFGFRHRVPNLGGRELTEPWAWRGHYYDTDYLFMAHPSTQGDKLVQNWDADSPRRWGYQTDPFPEHKYVTGGKATIANSGGTTTYEIAIPRSVMKLFDPSKMNACRFAFVVLNTEMASVGYLDKKGDMEFNMQYARGYGVFDHWNKYLSSFGPSWSPTEPAQTRWGIEGGTYSPDQDIPDQTPTVKAGEPGTAVRTGAIAQAPAVIPLPAVRTEAIFRRNAR
jgi:hypothetical protein